MVRRLPAVVGSGAAELFCAAEVTARGSCKGCWKPPSGRCISGTCSSFGPDIFVPRPAARRVERSSAKIPFLARTHGFAIRDKGLHRKIKIGEQCFQCFHFPPPPQQNRPAWTLHTLSPGGCTRGTRSAQGSRHPIHRPTLSRPVALWQCSRRYPCCSIPAARGTTQSRPYVSPLAILIASAGERLALA